MTPDRPRRPPGRRPASIRPRLIAVDDKAERVKADQAAAALQFGHDSSPWMTLTQAIEIIPTTELQFGHDSSPWMTSRSAWTPAAGSPLQFGHDSSPWMTPKDQAGLALQDTLLQFGHDSSPWMTTQPAISSEERRRRFNSATTHRRG